VKVIHAVIQVYMGLVSAIRVAAQNVQQLAIVQHPIQAILIVAAITNAVELAIIVMAIALAHLKKQQIILVQTFVQPMDGLIQETISGFQQEIALKNSKFNKNLEVILAQVEVVLIL
jgi:hypothetical protein